MFDTLVRKYYAYAASFLMELYNFIFKIKNKYKIICFVHTLDTYFCYNNTAFIYSDKKIKY